MILRRRAAARGRTVASVRCIAAVGIGWLALLVPSGAANPLEALAGRLAQRLAAERAAGGGPPLIRSAELDRLAARRAGEIAARAPGRRLGGREPVSSWLARAGPVRFRRALEFVHLQRHERDPVGAVLARRPDTSPFWQTVRSGRRPGRVGAGVARTADGWLVFVALLTEAPRSAGELRALERAVAREANTVRSARGLEPLQPDAALGEAARRHAEAMAAAGRVTHRLPGGPALAERVRRVGVRFRRLAENLAAVGDSDDAPARVLAGWLRSPGHRRNLLDRRFTRTGVGVAAGEDGSLYVTQLFVQPEPADPSR
ncbi:MAG: CAP domain-containing protein [Acidobacteria bacterium]|nr:MAG: CAP domain-containing protein [Acidobacteriota bacterium]